MDQARKGVFIVIEGTDGSGKGTQAQLLQSRLTDAGYQVEYFDFPRYNHPSSFFVKEYLNGAYGDADHVGPYTASLFYALDRYQAAPKILDALNSGKVVICNRYTGSNMAHQGTKFRNAEQRRGYFIWLDNLEFETLRIPRPDISFVLRVPADIAQMQVGKKDERGYTEKTHDIHEADLKHLERSVEVYDDLCQLFPKDFQRIDCMRSGKLLEIETIQSMLWEKISPLLPQPAQLEMTMPGVSSNVIKQGKTSYTNKYFTPDNLSDATRFAYAQHLDSIFGLQTAMLPKLTLYLAAQSDTPAIDRGETWHKDNEAKSKMMLNAVTPLAAISTVTAPINNQVLSTIAQKHLQDNYAAIADGVQLTDIWPRNELDVIPDIVYQHSNLPLGTIRNEVSAWPYERKLQTFKAYTNSLKDGAEQQNKVLEKIRYGFDLTCDYSTFEEMQSSGVFMNLEAQAPTPRYGYEVPEIIEAAGLADEFEKCFDISLELHSLLQSAGHIAEAQYAVLAGHRIRCKITCNALELMQMREFGAKPTTSPEAKKLINNLLLKISESHPLLGGIIPLA